MDNATHYHVDIHDHIRIPPFKAPGKSVYWSKPEAEFRAGQYRAHERCRRFCIVDIRPCTRRCSGLGLENN